MAAILKTMLVVVLAFGFLFPPEVEALRCHLCIAVSSGSCNNPTPCPPGIVNCGKSTTKVGDKEFSTYICGADTGRAGNDKCETENGQTACTCFNDLCNSVGHLHGWTFVQLVAISFVVVIVGAWAKP